MAISVSCDSCGQAYELNEQLAGRVFRCRRCGGAIQAPPDYQGYRSTAPAYPAELIYPQQPAYLAPPADYGGGYLASGTPLPPARRRRRRKQNSGPLPWLATAAGTLLGLAAVAAMMVASGMGPEGWVTLLNAPARERNKVRPITAPGTGRSPEPIFQQGLGDLNKVNSALASIYDEASAHQHRDELVTAWREYGEIEVRLRDAEFPDLPFEELERLQAIYVPQYKAAGFQAGREMARIARIPAARQVLVESLRLEGTYFEMTISVLMRRIAATPRQMMRYMAALTKASSQPNSDRFSLLYTERHIVEVVVQGLPVGAVQSVSERLREISNCQASIAKGDGESARFTIAPIRDVRALAAKIDFGTVTVLHVSQSLIVVEADASKVAALPPPAASLLP